MNNRIETNIPSFNFEIEHLDRPSNWDYYTAAWETDPWKYGQYLFSQSILPLFQPLLYFIPSLGLYMDKQEVDYFTGRTVTQLNSFTQREQNSLQNEFNELKEISEINKEITYAISPKGKLKSYGGALSLTSPHIVIPHNFLRADHLFGKETRDQNNLKSLTRLSDNELRFLLLREMGKIKHNHNLYKSLFKTDIFAMLLLGSIYIPLYGQIAVICTLIATYNLFIKELGEKEDRFAVEKLANYFESHEANYINNIESNDNFYKARLVAVRTLEKMRQLNLEKKKVTVWNHICIGKDGSDWRYINQVTLPSRRDRIYNYHINR